MDEGEKQKQGPQLMSELEVAEVLRCSSTKIKRLRLSGEISYLPGPPVLIAREDLDAFIERRKIKATAEVAAKGAEESRESARAWAIRQKFKRRKGRG